jgi:hypothetical protein
VQKSGVSQRQKREEDCQINVEIVFPASCQQNGKRREQFAQTTEKQ